MPQYMLICVTSQHWFRSERLVALLNRIRHPETYSFSIKLEIALTQAVDETPGLLSTQIVRSPIDLWAIHSEFDNFDHLLNDLAGMQSVHIAHGIMLQDIQGEQVDHRGTFVDAPFVARDATTKHSLLESNVLKTVPQTHLLHNEKSLIITQQTYPDGDIHLRNKHAWGVFPGCWYRLNVVPHRKYQAGQVLYRWLGPHLKALQLLTITESTLPNHRLQDCPRMSQIYRNATAEVGQQYVIITFDSGFCMKACPRVWNSPVKYEKHIISIEVFHFGWACTKMFGGNEWARAVWHRICYLFFLFEGQNYDRCLTYFLIFIANIETSHPRATG